MEPIYLPTDEPLILQDEEGNTVAFTILDVMDHEGDQYAVLTPAQEDEEISQIVITRFGEVEEDESQVHFDSVEDENLLQILFDRFKERHAEEYDFED